MCARCSVSGVEANLKIKHSIARRSLSLRWARQSLALAFFLVPIALLAQAQSAAPASGPAAAQTHASANAPAATPADSSVNLLTQATVQQGVLRCTSRINQVSNFLGFGPQAGAVLMLPSSQPDQNLFPVAMEIPAEGAVAYVASTFAPNQANGCAAVYDAVLYWPQSCESVADKQFANLKRIGQMKAAISVLDGGSATKVFLMPAGTGCVSIKKELVL
jgi:hypothetical protein